MSDSTLASSFYALTPERILAAVETLGVRCTGRCLTLNSMENRVYELELETDDPKDPNRFRVAKFYRPGRWSKEQLEAEHTFLSELVEAEVPVIAPVKDKDGNTLFLDKELGIYFTLFPKARGRTPEELSPENLQWMGRLLARMHTVGAQHPALERISLTAEQYGTKNLEFLESSGSLPMDIGRRYREVVVAIVNATKPLFDGVRIQRIHGDCHPGNILWGSEGPFFLDFDDMVMGPAVQDLWLLVSGRDEEGTQQFENILAGYEQMRDFNRHELKLVEPLRALRYIHFSAWIARRWEDPYFKRTFTQFGTSAYWEQQIADLHDQLEIITAPPPVIDYNDQE